MSYVNMCLTDWPVDTADTSSDSDWSDGVTMNVEYEVASLSEKENPLGEGSLSSDTDVSCTDFQRNIKDYHFKHIFYIHLTMAFAFNNLIIILSCKF
jgi:hypothetical protein